MHMKHLEYIIIYMSTDVSSPWRFSWGVIPILSDYQVLVMVKNPPASAGNAWDAGLIPVSGRSPGVGNGNQLWYPGLEYPMDRGVWWAIVHGIGKSQTWLSTHTHTHTHTSESYIDSIFAMGRWKVESLTGSMKMWLQYFLFWPFTYIHHMMNKSLWNGLSERRAIILGSKREGFTTRLIKWLNILSSKHPCEILLINS